MKKNSLELNKYCRPEYKTSKSRLGRRYLNQHGEEKKDDEAHTSIELEIALVKQTEVEA